MSLPPSAIPPPPNSSYATVAVFADTQLACVSFPPVCGEAFGGRRHTSKPTFASVLHLWLPVRDMFEKYVSTWFRGAINRVAEKVSALISCNLYWLSQW